MPSGTSPSPDSGRRTSNTPSTATEKTKDASRPSPGAMNGVVRQRTQKSSTGSPLSARGAAAAKRGAGPGKENDETQRAETGALLEDLNAQLRKAEQASEDYQKELVVLQSRLDEAITDQAKLEELAQSHADRVENMEVENKDVLRRHKDLKSKYESDLAASIKDKEEAAAREDELEAIIVKLKDALAQKESRRGSEGGGGLLQRAASFRGRSSPKPDGSGSPARDRSQDSTSLLTQKDKIIEGLRLELAEAQIKAVEIENAGGSRLQDLEKALLETKMANAKLMEESESYQVLLQEKTLTGDLARTPIFQTHPNLPGGIQRQPSGAGNRSSLADELENAKDDAAESEHDPNLVRRLEAELAAAQEQNKALTLYINKIITRLLQADQFEKLFPDGSGGLDMPTSAAPAKEQKPQSADGPESQEAAPSLLQRAGSLFGGRRQRPRSYQNPAVGIEGNIQPVPEASAGVTLTEQISNTTDPSGFLKPAVNEDPTLAPSLPIKRSASARGGKYTHRRVRSELPPTSVVNSIHKTSPPLDMISPRQAAIDPPTGAHPTELKLDEDAKRRSADAAEAEDVAMDMGPLVRQGSDSGYGDSQAPSEAPEMPSPPRSVAGSSTDGRGIAGAGRRVFDSSSGSTMRPLRLVQEKQEAEEAERKKVNRNSFMGWFARGPAVTSPPQQPANVVSSERPPTRGSQDAS